jgi:DinB superfamily
VRGQASQPTQAQRSCAEAVAATLTTVHADPRANAAAVLLHVHETRISCGVVYTIDGARQVLSRTPDTLSSFLSSISDEWLHFREASGEWSPYEVCGHLLHIEQTDWMDRTRVILTHGEDHTFEPVDREAGFARFSGWPVTDLVAAFKDARQANLAELDRLVTKQDLLRRGVHPEFGTVTLSQLLATWVVHDLNHLHQAVKTMAKHYTDAVGPWRAYLPILDVP